MVCGLYYSEFPALHVHVCTFAFVHVHSMYIVCEHTQSFYTILRRSEREKERKKDKATQSNTRPETTFSKEKAALRCISCFLHEHPLATYYI